MELILDSCDLGKIRQLCDILTISGVTTNPSIIAGSGMKPEEAIGGLVELLSPSQTLFVQAIRTDKEGIVEEARKIAALRPNTYVKIPVTREGLSAMKECKAQGIGVLATAIFTAQQGLLAALNGADYLAPYVNRMDNFGDGVQQVRDLLQMLRAYSLDTKVVAASFKNVHQVVELMKAGVHAVTVPCDIAFKLIDHPGTADAVADFSARWQNAFGRDSLMERK